MKKEYTYIEEPTRELRAICFSIPVIVWNYEDLRFFDKVLLGVILAYGIRKIFISDDNIFRCSKSQLSRALKRLETERLIKTRKTKRKGILIYYSKALRELAFEEIKEVYKMGRNLSNKTK
jgi:DNA-binding transcriptional ArsR family regulator